MHGAPEVVTRVWHEAADLGYGRYFIPQTKYSGSPTTTCRCSRPDCG